MLLRAGHDARSWVAACCRRPPASLAGRPRSACCRLRPAILSSGVLPGLCRTLDTDFLHTLSASVLSFCFSIHLFFLRVKSHDMLTIDRQASCYVRFVKCSSALQIDLQSSSRRRAVARRLAAPPLICYAAEFRHEYGASPSQLLE